MMSAWQEWKEKQKRTQGKNVSPLDFLNPTTEYAESPLQDERYSICKTCERFNKTTTQCRECGCIMKLKVKLADATCPLGKW